MPNHYIMRKYFLILALALFCTGAAAQSYIVSDTTYDTGVRLVKTSSVSLPNDLGKVDIFFIGAKNDFIKTYAVVIECRECTKAWYLDKGSYLVIDIPEKMTFAKGNKDIRPKVRYDKEAKKSYFEWVAEFEIPVVDSANLLDNISSLSFQLRDSNNLKQQFNLTIPQETGETMAKMYYELMTNVAL